MRGGGGWGCGCVHTELETYFCCDVLIITGFIPVHYNDSGVTIFSTNNFISITYRFLQSFHRSYQSIYLKMEITGLQGIICYDRKPIIDVRDAHNIHALLGSAFRRFF